MSTNKGTLNQVCALVTQQLAHSDQSPDGFVAALLRLCSDLSQRLETLPKVQFAKAWLLHTLAIELLKYAIEDDYIDISDVRPVAVAMLQDLLESDDWVHPKLESFLDACRRVAEKKPIRARRVELRSSTPTGTCRVTGLLAAPNKPLIPVSGERFCFVPILEDSVANPAYVRDVVNAFAEHLVRLKREEGISCLCFIEKAVGPIGALSMLAALVSGLNLPACVYRANHWPERAKLAGYRPRPMDRIALVYDLLVTGDGIRQAAKDLKARFGTTTVAAVVLFGYGSKRDTVEIDGQTIKVEAIGWYQAFAPQIEKIHTGKATRTKDITILSNGNGGRNARALAVGGGASVSLPSHGGGTPMDSPPQ